MSKSITTEQADKYQSLYDVIYRITYHNSTIDEMDEIIEASDKVTGLSTLQSEKAELVEMLDEARLQIEYLQDKFGETGSGNSVLSRMKQLLTKIK